MWEYLGFTLNRESNKWGFPFYLHFLLSSWFNLWMWIASLGSWTHLPHLPQKSDRCHSHFHMHVWISLNRSLTPFVTTNLWSEQLLWEWNLSFTVQLLIIAQGVMPFGFIYKTLRDNSSSVLLKASCWKLKLGEITIFNRIKCFSLICGWRSILDKWSFYCSTFIIYQWTKLLVAIILIQSHLARCKTDHTWKTRVKRIFFKRILFKNI